MTTEAFWKMRDALVLTAAEYRYGEIFCKRCGDQFDTHDPGRCEVAEALALAKLCEVPAEPHHLKDLKEKQP